MTQPYAIGIDIGGTKIAAGLVDRNGQILHRFTTRDHAQRQPAVVIDAVMQACSMLLQESGVAKHMIEAVGIGFPGNTNGRAGIVLTSSNLPAWDHFPLRQTLVQRLGMPVVLENDANLCALGEHRFGAGRGTQNMCYVTFSTGYGIGILIHGQIYSGSSGTAGELGHVVIEIGGPPCSCGKPGCIMAYASGIGISRMVYEYLARGEQTALRALIPSDGQRVPAELVAQAASAGDAVALNILHKAGYYCGIGLSMIVQVLNPELIIVGGGLTNIGDLVWQPALAAMREYTQPELLNSVQVTTWQLGNDIGILGAAAAVFG